MKVHCAQCPKCLDTIYSRARHDFRPCSCGCVAVDGGSDYFKLSFDPSIGPQIKHATIEIDATDSELYDDWNYNKNKYGLIKDQQ